MLIVLLLTSIFEHASLEYIIGMTRLTENPGFSVMYFKFSCNTCVNVVLISHPDMNSLR